MARCTVTICHSATRDLPGSSRQADIVVAGVGKAKFVQGDWIKPGAIVIDVGINRTAGRQARAATSTSPRRRSVAGWITPVPGGVGPMTIATLLANTLRAAELQDAAAPGRRSGRGHDGGHRRSRLSGLPSRSGAAQVPRLRPRERLDAVGRQREADARVPDARPRQPRAHAVAAVPVDGAGVDAARGSACARCSSRV